MRLVAGDRQDDRWKRARVWLDDRDVTRECFMADDVLGNVGLFVRDSNGHIIKDGYGGPQEVFLQGKVRIEVDDRQEPT